MSTDEDECADADPSDRGIFEREMEDSLGPPIRTDEDDETFRCWCGAVGTYEELFDEDGLGTSCGGTGYVDCYCGGDQCVCHHHGQEQECSGCDECPERDCYEGDEYEYDEYEYDEDEP